MSQHLPCINEFACQMYFIFSINGIYDDYQIKRRKNIGNKHVKNQTLEGWTENHKTRWSVWNSVIYWFINYACTCQGFIHLKNSRYLNASEKRIKLSTRNINFVGWNLFHEKYKTHVHVTAVQIFEHILILFLWVFFFLNLFCTEMTQNFKYIIL